MYVTVLSPQPVWLLRAELVRVGGVLGVDSPEQRHGDQRVGGGDLPRHQGQHPALRHGHQLRPQTHVVKQNLGIYIIDIIRDMCSVDIPVHLGVDPGPGGEGGRERQLGEHRVRGGEEGVVPALVLSRVTCHVSRVMIQPRVPCGHLSARVGLPGVALDDGAHLHAPVSRHAAVLVVVPPEHSCSRYASGV